jgi:glycosyltransferase involved in cell wall biosynthesis
MALPRISIVIPVFNSASILPELLKETTLALTGKLTYELILVDDGSTDTSWKTLTALAKEYPLRALRLRKNAGQDNAIMAGLNQAKGDFAIIMDDDLQHDPKDILRLLSEIEKGTDVCYANFTFKKQSIWKNTGSFLNGKMAEMLIGKPAHLYLSPFKIIRSSLVKEMLLFQGPFPYVDGIILTLTASISQIDCIHHNRHEGKGNYTLGKSTDVFLNLMTGFSVKPLRLLMLAGICALSTGLGGSIYYLIDYFTDKKPVEGWITLVLLVLFFGGSILFGIGLLGEYVARIYLTTNRRPPYSIAEVISPIPDEK